MDTYSAEQVISKKCGFDSLVDCNQILDIIISKEDRSNKESAFYNVTKSWGVKDWQVAVKEFYLSFSKAKLPHIRWAEIATGTPDGIAIEGIRDNCRYKKAPASYYLQLACDNTHKPVLGTPTLEYERDILLSVYVAISCGENYSTCAYPPKSFIDNVLKLDVSQEDFYATVMRACNKPESLESIVCEVAKQNSDILRTMKASYKKLVGTDLDAVKSKVAPTLEAASIKASKVSKTFTTSEEHKHREKISSNVKTVGFFTKYGFWLLIINGVATPAKFWVGINLIKSASGFMGILGTSFLAILTSFIPLIGCVATVMMLFTGIMPGRGTNKRIAYLCFCLSILCTAYSAVSLVKLLLSVIASFITQTFTPENIARGATKGVLDGVKGIGEGIADFVAGMFD